MSFATTQNISIPANTLEAYMSYQFNLLVSDSNR
jgi:hypothetical protein